MPKPKQYQRRTPSKAKRATKRRKPNAIRAMLADFKATHPVTGRTTGDDRGNQFRRDFFRVLHGVSIPTDHARAALDRIDLPPADFIADVRRQLADKRGLTDARAIAGIAESDVESAIDGAISDVAAYLTKNEAECPECFPLPDGLASAKPKQAQRILRDHLRRVIDRRADDPRYQARRFHDAAALLGVLDDYGDFVNRCRGAKFTDAEIDAEALWILGMVRDAMKDVPALAGMLLDAPTPDTAPASAGYHRELLEGVRATIPTIGLKSRDDWFNVREICERIGYSRKQTDRKIKAARLKPEKRAGINHYGPWLKVCEALGAPADTTPPKRTPRKPRKDRKPQH